MVPSGLADPAFAYAISKADFCPIPRGRSFVSKEEGTELSDVWNGFVDEYIAQGSDERPRVEIERAAKINTHCGALFRVCEGPSCGKLEGRDVERLSLCSKCKIAVYCSRTCQAASWKEHKEQCSSGSRVEQMLPSQAAIQEHVFPALWKDALNLTHHVLSKAPEK
ncbi:hypothetical protein GLOTRDRAFT_74639 [Gloeophyllum trabeum ATCC 11539]|uniref:MYND-type domain-containing protein n=1 Tax=Gloeophyllum trabeum (strain ATCC 11539 / FP-39264 / Madison 617) TaxID=670483 RepID=S7Q815_GLOTA|nr:uncharacterized protein GLOTRDRAFT_74639 [Gloeophyllum trabeum ATCC 11539]EPQ56126.1 hypothetical protein GLOTRDRAFT_74639 [Gloeophyllum trabeum ATCC 11539]